MRISVIGLGKLGLPMVAAFANKGNYVVGIDVNVNTVAALQKGEIPIQETDLPKYMFQAADYMDFTTDFNAVKDTSITFIIVPTPSKEDGTFTNEYVLNALRSICPVLKEKEQKHLIVVTSTVMPLSSKKQIIPLIEQLTEKKVGTNIGYCYNPEFIALGSVIKNILNPDAILIGESDQDSGEFLDWFYSGICENHAPVCRMSIENAECAKLMLNVAVTNKISLANTFAEIAELIPGGNIDQITEFIGKDKRIGEKYFKGGTAYAGPCFPRDCIAFSRLTDKLGIWSRLAVEIHRVNDNQNIRLLRRTLDLMKPSMNRVAILGMAYKPNTGLTEQSAGMYLAKMLQSYKKKVLPYDELAEHGELGISHDVRSVLTGADLAVITLPHYKFSPELFKIMRTRIVLDCWRILNKEECDKAGIEYHAIGLNE